MRRQLTIALAAAALSAALVPAVRAQSYRGVYVAAPGDIWVVGENGTLIHGRAGSWVKAPDNSPLPHLSAVTGFGPNDVWVVGDEGTILHWNGSALSRPNSGTGANLVAVWGCAPNDVWALGASGDDREPAVAVHYNGSSWSQQRLSLSFRPSGIAGSCGDVVVSGISFFDPRPDQRRDVGVVARLRGGQWVTTGWDGRRMTDEQIGGTAWRGAASGAGTVMIWGNGKVLVSRGGGAWTALAGAPSAQAMIMTADGSPVAIHAGGFSRLAGGQWRTVGQGAMENTATNAYVATAQQATAPTAAGGRDTAAVRRITARMEAISRAIPDGGMPNQAQMTEIMQLQQQLMAANGGSLMPGGMNMQQMQQMSAQAQAAGAEAQRNQGIATRNATLRFGEHPAVFSGPGSDFYVAGEGMVMHVSGDASKVVFSQTCLIPGVPASATAECRADGGTGGPPPALTVPPPMPHLEGPAVQGPTTGSPLPSIKKPRIRIP